MTLPAREGDVQRDIVRALEAHGCRVVRVNAGRRGGCRLAERGTPDLWVLLPSGGRLMLVEVKRPGGKATPEQLAWLDDARARGFAACVVDSVDAALDALRLARHS